VNAPLYVADTSILVGLEQERITHLPDNAPVALSVVTLAELHLGVLNASDGATRRRRLITLAQAQTFECLTIDRSVAERWAGFVAHARESGRRLKVNDAWIAAIAAEHQATVLTQDGDFDELPVDVVRV
jgi:predicted nucleic acid-binding protein